MTFFKNKVNAKDYIIDMETEGLNKDNVKRDEKGYPLKEDGTIDWDLAGQEKDKFLAEYEKVDSVGRKIKRPKPTNVTPKKKKRKKK